MHSTTLVVQHQARTILELVPQPTAIVMAKPLEHPLRRLIASALRPLRTETVMVTPLVLQPVQRIALAQPQLPIATAMAIRLERQGRIRTLLVPRPQITMIRMDVQKDLPEAIRAILAPLPPIRIRMVRPGAHRHQLQTASVLRTPSTIATIPTTTSGRGKMINVELPRISRQFFYDKRCWASSSELRNYRFKELRSRHRVVLRMLTLRSFRKIIGKRDLPEIAHAFEHCLL